MITLGSVLLFTTLKRLEVIVRKMAWLLGQGTVSAMIGASVGIAVLESANTPSRGSLWKFCPLALNEAGYNLCTKASSHNFESMWLTAEMDMGCLIRARAQRYEAL